MLVSDRRSDETSRIRIVAPDSAPSRADVLLHSQLPSLSRRQVRELFASGRVRINDGLARKGSAVHAGDIVDVDLSEAERTGPVPDDHLTIDVLFEDAALVALNKPAGVPTLPLRVGERGTVANFLTARYPDSPLRTARFEAGLVHRLDTGTSGLILAARTVDAYHHLRDQFRRHRVVKSYLALVQGLLPGSRTIHSPIAHSERDARRMEIHSRAGSPRRGKAHAAKTRFHPVKRFGKTTLVAVQIRTGVRHQIRLHLASIRHPIVGDDVYIGPADSPASGDESSDRLLLHARRVRFTHPSDGRTMRIVAPLSADFESALKRLEAQSSSGSSS